MKVQTDLKAGFLGINLCLDLEVKLNLGGHCGDPCGKPSYCKPRC